MKPIRVEGLSGCCICLLFRFQGTYKAGWFIQHIPYFLHWKIILAFPFSSLTWAEASDSYQNKANKSNSAKRTGRSALPSLKILFFGQQNTASLELSFISFQLQPHFYYIISPFKGSYNPKLLNLTSKKGKQKKKKFFSWVHLNSVFCPVFGAMANIVLIWTLHSRLKTATIVTYIWAIIIQYSKSKLTQLKIMTNLLET